MQPATITNLETRRQGRSEIGQEFTFADITELCAFLQHEIVVSKMRYNKIADRAGCCVSTVSKMASGETKQPRASTALAILGVFGFQLVVRQ